MADNTILPGTGETYGSDDISGVNYQRVKLIHGADGVNDGDVSQLNGLPIQPVHEVDLMMSRELLAGLEKHFIFGFNASVTTAWEDVHPTGGDINWLTTAGKVEILSSDAADTSGGAGCRSVELHGLSATGVDQSEVIATNGVSTVQSTLDYIRVNKMHNEEVGTYGGSHQGDITCRVTGGGATLSKMTGVEGAVDTSVQYGSGEAGNGYWSVPLNKLAYLIGGEVIVNTTGTKTADVILYERDGLLTTSAPHQPRRVLWSAIEAQGRIPIQFRSYVKMKPLADFFFRVQASNANTKIEIYLDFFVVTENGGGT